MVGSRPAARCNTFCSLATLAVTALLASSCGWLSGDIYPNWLPYVEARVDIAAAAAKAGIGALRNLDAVEYVSFIDPADGVDKSKMMAYIKGLGGEALVAFEPSSMTIAKSWKRDPDTAELLNALGPNLVPMPKGFASGNVAFSMANLEAPPNIVAGGMVPGGILIAIGDPVEYFVMHTWYNDTVPEYRLEIQKFDSAFSLLASTSRLLDTANSSMNMTDAAYFAAVDTAGGIFRMLMETGSGTYVFSFENEAALLSSTPLTEDASALRSGPFPVGNNGHWLTADGVVAINRGESMYLSRYEYGWTAAETVPTDQLQITGDTEAYQIMSFDASGSWWYLYDRLTEQLYALRTWW